MSPSQTRGLCFPQNIRESLATLWMNHRWLHECDISALLLLQYDTFLNDWINKKKLYEILIASFVKTQYPWHLEWSIRQSQHLNCSVYKTVYQMRIYHGQKFWKTRTDSPQETHLVQKQQHRKKARKRHSSAVFAHFNWLSVYKIFWSYETKVIIFLFCVHG